MRGTGKNNHDNSIVKINEIEILNNGLFQGLALVIFRRTDFSVSEISYYDTFNAPPKEFLDVSYTKYTYENITDEIISEEIKVKVINQKLFPSYKLNQKLKSLNEKHLIAIVSNYGWEKYITNDLIDTLTKFGALNIVEFKGFINYREAKTNSTFEEDLINKTFYYHPFAFVGIPNIGASNGFESIRTNKGHFLTTNNLPKAELLVRIMYDEKAMNYFFDKQQYNEKFIFSDDYEYLFNSPDYSLKNLMDLLIYANSPTESNNIFVIYNINKFIHMYLPKSATTNEKIYMTTFDIVTLGKDNPSQRTNSEGVIYQNGLILEDTKYYEYFYNVAIKKNDCPLPYNLKIKECLNSELLKLEIPILKCGIGLTPQVCINNSNKEYLFTGFLD